MSGDPILAVEDLRVTVESPDGRELHVVDGISFDVAPGETLALVGESGSGKTMTLRAILGLLPRVAHVTAGSIRFAGREVTELPADELRQILGRDIGMVFQEPMTALNPVMRVGDQIAEGPLAHEQLGAASATERAIELLELVGVPDPERRVRAYPHELSGGLRQRVMIAVALSCRPRLLLCDEPTTALDVTIQDQILRLLDRLQEETGVALVFVTHDLAVVAEFFERVAVMYAGQVMETGPVHEVLHQPRHAYTLGLLRAVPRPGVVGARLGAIPGSPPNLADPPRGCRFHPRCELATDECRAGPLELEPLSDVRATACVHHEECARIATREPVL